MKQKEFEIATIIASRKTEFYYNARNRLLVPLPLTVDKKEARLRLRQAISELDNTLFISEEEKASNIINPRIPVSKLKLKKKEIVDRVIKAMTAPNSKSTR